MYACGPFEIVYCLFGLMPDYSDIYSIISESFFQRKKYAHNPIEWIFCAWCVCVCRWIVMLFKILTWWMLDNLPALFAAILRLPEMRAERVPALMIARPGSRNGKKIAYVDVYTTTPMKGQLSFDTRCKCNKLPWPSN